LPGDDIDVKVWPGPFSFTKDTQITFTVNGTAGGEVKIYTISGKLVKELVIEAGESEVNWDVLNEDGNSITAGLYIYTVTDEQGNKKTGKLVTTE
jgi:flagellar hook assembly protein FlgD